MAFKLGDGGWNWNTILKCNGTTVAAGVRLKDPLSQAEKSELRWYIEDYVRISSFDLTRARDAANLVRRYAQNIADQLNLLKTVQSAASSSTSTSDAVSISLAIRDADEDERDEKATIQQLHWELLEDLDCWKEHGFELVVRRLRSSDPIPGVLNSVRSWPTESMSRESVNVLLVVARDTQRGAAYGDISLFTSLEVLTRVQREMNTGTGLLQLNIEVVRPGTISALKLHLDRTKREKGPGYFHLVHFDLHGIVDKRAPSEVEEGLLLFNDKKAYPARIVAQWLKIYRIPCVVLNACESARADVGEQANMARAFLDGGVSNVLAMTFKVSSGAVELFLRKFYIDLFVSGSTFSQAAHAARAELKTHPVRDARFRRQRELLDWFIPVIYTSGSDFSVIPGRRALERSVPHVMPISKEPTRDELVIGRDFDLLRFEQKLVKHKRIFLTAPPGFGKTMFLKWACKIWNATKFRDSVIYADLAATELREPAGLLKLLMEELSDPEEDDPSEDVQDYVMNVLGVPHDQKASAATVINILSKRQAILVLDGLHTFRLEDDEGIPPVIELVEAMCRFSPELLVVCAQRHMEGMTLDIDLNDEEYSLPSLELADASELYGFALKSDDGSAKIDGKDLEDLFRFCKLVQGIPAAVSILEEALELGWSLDFFMTNIYIRTRNVNAALSRLLLRESGPFAELNAIASGLDSDELPVLVALGMYWHEGPYIKAFSHKLTEDLICPDQAPIIRVLNLLEREGYLKIDRRQPSRISWIHPLFTVFSRSKTHMLKATGRCTTVVDMALAVFDYLVYNDGDDRLRYYDRRWFLKDIDQQSVFTRGLRGEQKDTLERCLQNTTTALLLCSEVDNFPINDWPAEHFMNYTMHLAGTASAVESAYLTSKYDSLLNRILRELLDRPRDDIEPRDVRILLAFLVFLILARTFTSRPEPGSKILDRYTELFETTTMLYKHVSGEDEVLLQAKTQVYMVMKKWDEAEEALLAMEKLGSRRWDPFSMEELRSSIRDTLDQPGQFGGSISSTHDIREKVLAREGPQITPEQLVVMKKALRAARMLDLAKQNPGAAANLLPSDQFLELIGTMKGKRRLFGEKRLYAAAQRLTDQSKPQELLELAADPSFRLGQLESVSDTLNWVETHEMHLKLEMESFLDGKWLETVEHHKAALDSLGNRPVENRKNMEATGRMLESSLDLLDFERFSKVKTAEAAKEIYRQKIEDYDKYADEVGLGEEERNSVRAGLQWEIDALERNPENAAVYFDTDKRKAAEDDLKEIMPYVLSKEGRTEGAQDAAKCREYLAVFQQKPGTDEAVEAAYAIEELAKTSKVARFLCPVHKGLGLRAKILRDVVRVEKGMAALTSTEDMFKQLTLVADLNAALETLGETPDDPEYQAMRPFAQRQEGVCLFAIAKMQMLGKEYEAAIAMFDTLFRKYADGSFKDIQGPVWDYKIATARCEQTEAKAALAGKHMRWNEGLQLCDEYISMPGQKDNIESVKRLRALFTMFVNQ